MYFYSSKNGKKEQAPDSWKREVNSELAELLKIFIWYFERTKKRQNINLKIINLEINSFQKQKVTGTPFKGSSGSLGKEKEVFE